MHNIGTARGSSRRLLARFGAVHRESARPFDVVHGFFGWCGPVAAVAGWRFGVPVVFHPSGGEFVALRDIDYGMRTTLRGRLGMRVALAGARRVTVASRFMQRLAVSNGSPRRMRAAGRGARSMAGDARLDRETPRVRFGSSTSATFAP